MGLILITIIFMGLAVLGISIKIWAKKDGEFSGTCASQNPMLNKNNDPCGYCENFLKSLKTVHQNN